jgi:hypothetical protein
MSGTVTKFLVVTSGTVVQNLIVISQAVNIPLLGIRFEAVRIA